MILRTEHVIARIHVEERIGQAALETRDVVADEEIAGAGIVGFKESRDAQSPGTVSGNFVLLELIVAALPDDFCYF